MGRIFAFAFAFALLLAAGCRDVDSQNILTRGMYASFSANANGSGSTTLTAQLFLEDPSTLDYIDLEGDDRLIAHQGPVANTMDESNVLNVVTYRSDFAVDEGGTSFRIELERSVDDDAPNSTTFMPPGFDYTTLPAATASRATELTVAWTPAGTTDEMRWNVQGDCLVEQSGIITGDPGTLTLGAGTLMKRQPANATEMVPDSCLTTLTIFRSHEGTVDAAFEEGGRFTAQQSRPVQFTSGP